MLAIVVAAMSAAVVVELAGADVLTFFEGKLMNLTAIINNEAWIPGSQFEQLTC